MRVDERIKRGRERELTKNVFISFIFYAFFRQFDDYDYESK